MVTVVRRTLHDKIFIIALSCAGLSLFIGTPQLTAINWATIGTLFALMISVQLLRAMHLLDTLRDWLLVKSHDTRQMCQLFILLAFGGSMILTNDVAILTLIPIFLTLARRQHLAIAYPATLIIMAANLGSAFTPIGNPQNLFLVTFYHVNLFTFFKLSTPLMLASLALLVALSWRLPRLPLTVTPTKSTPISRSQIGLAGGLLSFIMLGIFNLVPISLVIIGTIVVGLMINRRVFQYVDYALLLTFICFFIFVSAISHNPAITHWLNQLTQTAPSVYITGLITSQVISNVPAAILLANFTPHLSALFLGVNIGGLGSLVASLANLLALKQLLPFNDEQPLHHFLIVFTALNGLGLFILGLGGWFYLQL